MFDKKIVLTALGSLALVAGSHASAGLIAHYTFDNAADLGENTGSATIPWGSFSGVTQTTGTIGSGAGSFTAGTSQAWTGGFNGADLSNFTVSMHVKGAGAAWRDYISLGTGNNLVHVLEQNGSGSVSHFNIDGVNDPDVGVGGDTGTAGGSSVAVNDGAWHHIGLTVSGGTATLYVDGIARSSGAYTGSGTITAFQLASRFGDGGRAITAELDDVAVYDTALSAGQMAHLANNVATDNPIPEPGSLALLALGGLMIARRRRG